MPGGLRRRRSLISSRARCLPTPPRRTAVPMDRLFWMRWRFWTSTSCCRSETRIAGQCSPLACTHACMHASVQAVCRQESKEQALCVSDPSGRFFQATAWTPAFKMGDANLGRHLWGSTEAFCHPVQSIFTLLSGHRKMLLLQ